MDRFMRRLKATPIESRTDVPFARIEAISLNLSEWPKSAKTPKNATIIVRLTRNKSVTEVEGSVLATSLAWTPAFEFPLGPGDIIVDVIVKRAEPWIPDRKLERVNIKIAQITSGEEGGLYEYRYQSSATHDKPTFELTISFSGLPSQANAPLVENPKPDQGESAAKEAASDAEGLRLPAGFDTTSKVIDTTIQLVVPVQSAVGRAESLIGTLESLSKAMRYMDGIVELIKTFAEIHPISKLAVKSLTTIYDLVKAQGDRDQNVKALAASMCDMLASLSEIQEMEKIKLLQSVIDLAMTRINECAEFLKVYARHGFWGRLIRQSLTSYTADEIRRFQEGFTQLKEKFNTAISIQTLNTAVEIVGVLKHNLGSIEAALTNKADEDRLNSLPRSKRGSYDRGNQCLQNTRQDILDLLYDWIDSKQHNTFWLRGPAGSGKSTIASTVAAQLHDDKSGLGRLGLGSLGATFFCKRDDETLNRPTLVLPTIAFRLASSYPSLRAGIVSALKANPDVGEGSIANQFQELIVQPLSMLPNDLDIPPVVIIIDAIDECGDVDTREALLECLENACDLPVWFKILVTSRPTDDIKPYLDSFPCGHEIDTSSSQSTSGVKAYTEYRIAQLRRKRGLGSDWPGESKTEQLVKRAEGLFIWVTVTFDFISDLKQSSPSAAVELILESSIQQHLGALDALYRTVLVQDLVKAQDFALIRAILGFIVVAKIPLSLRSICSLLNVENERATWAIGRIASVLRTEPGSTIRVIHQSFLDFLHNRERSEEFFIDDDHHNALLAGRCLQILNAKLHTNMCKLTDMSTLNEEIADLAVRLDEYLPEYVLYSCQYWAEHVSQSSNQDPQILHALRKFCNEHVLHWMEVMSLKGEGRNVVKAMRKVQKWLQPDDQLMTFVTDIVQFAVTHAYVISQCAPHIYVNACVFTPPKSALSLLARRTSTTSPTLLNQPKNTWDPRLLTLTGHTKTVTSVAFSPDGSKIVSGGYDNAIHVWDAESGSNILGPSLVHTGWVRSVTFSPDGMKIVSGSDDNTLRIWHAETGLSILGPMLGHTGSVNSVAFSPDGTKIVSGSGDGTLRVWDAESGSSILGPWLGHASSVNSVAFSPDGTKIVSGSSATLHVWDGESGLRICNLTHTCSANSIAFSPDGTKIVSGGYDSAVHIWDAVSGSSIVGPLLGHDGWVHSVAFSPDGTKIVSGSQDHTLRVWDADSGLSILGPLLSHTSPVHSVAFSPDGTKIVSGSWDKMLLVWDAESGSIIRSTLLAHANTVSTVALSPDGTKVVSGSTDNTLRVWDVESGSNILRPLLAHPGSVHSIAFSPDGTRIASGSSDNTVHVWDAESRSNVLGPLRGHTSVVKSVAFSPDGTKIVSGAGDNALRVWDAESGSNILGPLLEHTSFINSVVFSPDGTKIVSASDDSTLRIWDAESGSSILGPLLGHTSSVHSAAFSPDGTKFVSGSHDKTLRVWDVESGSSILGPLLGHTSSVNSVAFSPDGTKIVSGSSDNTLRFWDAESGSSTVGPLLGHTSSVNSVAFSHDGTKIVSGSSDDTLRVWNAESTSRILGPLLGHTSWVHSVAFSPDGTRIVSGSYDCTLRIWDAESGWNIFGPLLGHKSSINSVAFSPDGTKIVSGSDDNTLRVWDAKSRSSILGPLLGHTSVVNSVAFSPDGTKIVSGSSDYTLRVWDSESGSTILGPLFCDDEWVISVAFSPDGTKIVSGSTTKLRVWDAESGLIILGPLRGHASLVGSVGFSPDGTKIVSGSNDHTLRVWDAESGSCILGPLLGHTGWVRSVAFSPDGNKIVSSSTDNTLRIWDAESGLTILGPLLGHTKMVNSVAFSPDGTRIVSCSSDNTLRVWDAASGSTILGSLVGHTGLVNSVAFSPDGAKIVSGSDDHTLYVWDTTSGSSILGPLLGHASPVKSVAFSPHGTKIASSSEDNTLRVWDVESGSTTRDPLQTPTIGVTSIAFTRDGHRIALQLRNHTFYMLDLESGSYVFPNNPISSPSPVLSDLGWILDQDGKRALWIPSHLRHDSRAVGSFKGNQGVQLVWFNESFRPMIVTGLDFAWWSQTC